MNLFRKFFHNPEIYPPYCALGHVGCACFMSALMLIGKINKCDLIFHDKTDLYRKVPSQFINSFRQLKTDLQNIW